MKLGLALLAVAGTALSIPTPRQLANEYHPAAPAVGRARRQNGGGGMGGGRGGGRGGNNNGGNNGNNGGNNGGNNNGNDGGNDGNDGGAVCAMFHKPQVTDPALTLAAPIEQVLAFPITAQLRADVLAYTDAVSPFVDADPQLVSTCAAAVAAAGVPAPAHAGEAGLWAEFEEVLTLQRMRRGEVDAAGWPAAVMELPRLYAGFTMEQAAESVHTDFPSHWPSLLVQQFLGEGAQMEPTIVPQLTAYEFVNKAVLLARVIGWAVSTVSPTAFSCKWTYGRARPEELAWAVAGGGCGAPAAVRAGVAAMQLGAAPEFTAYPEGSPVHPSFPAMHSAASSSSLYFSALLDLSVEQMKEARRLDYAVAHSRSVAGVHYRSDNLAGLAIGQQLIAEQLPPFLRSIGLSAAAVAAAQAKIARVKHDWYLWAQLGCDTDSSPAACDCPGCAV